MARILFYEEKYYMFSNFSAHQVEYEGVLYPTAEHAYQSAKFIDPRVKEEVRKAKSPLEAKYLANEVYRDIKRKDWEKIKMEIMYKVIKAKVEQHEEVKNKLVETGDLEIAENSPVDSFWGLGKDKKGENQLGKILMRVREEVIVLN